MKQIVLQLERLSRHHQHASQTYDPVTMLDLSHTLRIWTELKDVIAVSLPQVCQLPVFQTAVPIRRSVNASKRRRYLFVYLINSVTTYAGNGEVFSASRELADGGSFTVHVRAIQRAHGFEFSQLAFVGVKDDAPLRHALTKSSVTNCNYLNWLSSEAVRIAYPNERAEIEKVSISREMLIRRVANVLDGSHASHPNEVQNTNKFDRPVRFLLGSSIAGLSIPYFILLKIAQDILETLPPLLHSALPGAGFDRFLKT